MKHPLYVWDEPLNYIDVISRMQIEAVIMEYTPGMIVAEHDQMFLERVSTWTRLCAKGISSLHWPIVDKLRPF